MHRVSKSQPAGASGREERVQSLVQGAKGGLGWPERVPGGGVAEAATSPTKASATSWVSTQAQPFGHTKPLSRGRKSRGIQTTTKCHYEQKQRCLLIKG